MKQPRTPFSRAAVARTKPGTTVTSSQEIARPSAQTRPTSPWPGAKTARSELATKASVRPGSSDGARYHALIDTIPPAAPIPPASTPS